MELHGKENEQEFMPYSELTGNVLINYDIRVDNIENIKFKDTEKQRAVYKLETDKGLKCLKKVYYDEGTLLFIYSVIEWLNAKKILCPRLLPTKKGLRYIRYNNGLFILTDWIEGRKCDYEIEDDIKAAADNLARIHKYSTGFKPIDGSTVLISKTDFYQSFNKHFQQLLELSNKAFIIKDKYSKLFLENFDFYLRKAEDSLYLLSGIDYNNISYDSICHLDYVNKNLIYTPDNKIYVIDFDRCQMGTPVYDINVFLRRILKRKTTSYDFEIFKSAIESYENVRKLNKDEMILLISILMFPSKFWKISRDYYKNRKICNKDAFLSLIEDLISQQNDFDNFCNTVWDYIK